MKISLIANRTNDWYVQELKKVAKNQRIEIEVVLISDYENWGKKIEKLGDVIWWIGAALPNKFSVRPAFLKRCLEAKKLVVNQGLATHPQIVFKSFQQMSLVRDGISTFAFNNPLDLQAAIESGKLKYPFIMKPDYGNQGHGIVLVKNDTGFKKLKTVKGFIFQNFIENDGDYRVFVLGGRAMWVSKRVAQEGSFLNNVAQGGQPQLVPEGKEKARICQIGEKIAAKFDLNLCGIDVIKDKKTGRLYFMEVNTLPSLKVFQPVFDYNLMGQVLDYFKLLNERKTQTVERAVTNYYNQSLPYLLGTKQFHYLVRRALWFDDTKAEKKLASFRSDFLKIIETKNETKVTTPSLDSRSLIRAPFVKKHPELPQYDKWLFRWLFAQTVYGVKLDSQVLEKVRRETLKKFSQKLLKDKEALFYLSTYAVTCVYNIHFFLGESKKAREKTGRLLLQLVQKKLKEQKKGDLVFAIYLLTHAILGESKFYYQAVCGKLYIEMFKLVESLIRENYIETSLDCKLEFLVCGRLIDQQSDLESVIYSEVESSLSPIGNFIADTPDQLNPKADMFSRSEHRNILYLMSKHKKLLK